MTSGDQDQKTDARPDNRTYLRYVSGLSGGPRYANAGHDGHRGQMSGLSGLSGMRFCDAEKSRRQAGFGFERPHLLRQAYGPCRGSR